MPIRTIATLAIAVVLGLIAVVLVNGYLGARKKAEVTQVAAVAGSPVVVAAVPISRGVIIQPQLLKVANYPANAVPAGAFTTVAQLTGGKDVQRMALRDLQPDEPVLAARVTPPGGKLNLADIIDPGMQAVTLRSSDITGVGGFVLPGDRVDVLMTRTAQSNGASTTVSQSVTQAVAQNIRVLAIDQSDDDELNKPVVVKAITIQVTPDQAQSITLAQSVGSLSLALRHVTDTQPLNKLATTVASFGFNTPRSPSPIGPPRPRLGPGLTDLGTVRVTRATDTTLYAVGAR
jgi:pilus assembly protein CpaB